MPLTMKTKSRGKTNIKYSALWREKSRRAEASLGSFASQRIHSHHRENNNFPIIEMPVSHRGAREAGEALGFE